MGKPLLEVSYSSDYEVGWVNHTWKVSYSSYYEVGWANDTKKSRIQVTMRGDGQITLRILVFKWLWGGMGRPHLEVSYSSDYEVGWANHT